MNSKRYRHVMSQLRLSSHKLRIETGRYGRNREERHDRICVFCDSRDIEDQFHFIFKCHIYNNLRKRYISRYYWHNHRMFKMIGLLQSENQIVLNNLSCYINCAIKIRNNLTNT